MPMNVMLQDQRRNGESRTPVRNDGVAAVALPRMAFEQGAVVVDVDALPDHELADVVRLHSQKTECVVGMTSSTDPGRLERLLQLGLDGLVPAGAGAAEFDCALASARYQADKARGLKDRVAELERKLDDRILIERAKGIIASRAQIGEEEALRRLRREARNQRRSMRDIAQRLLDAERMLTTGI